MNNKILTKEQIQFVNVFSESDLTSNFYLSGGTALVGFYYPYRYSDDLDFFSEEEFDINQILTFLKTNKSKIGYLDFDFRTVYNRNLFFLNFDGNYQLKLEFTYYPFPRIENKTKINKLAIDSVIDIATNKLFTIYQSSRTRDFTDLYTIVTNNEISIDDLISKAKVKFDWHVDKFVLGKSFLGVNQNSDTPRFFGDFPVDLCNDFFIRKSKELGQSMMKFN
ncbi:MAG: nucleotidyl transferase AbiEii/AbiGii toxin family protein [bacterium]